jgi:ATP-dependent Zn protease
VNNTNPKENDMTSIKKTQTTENTPIKPIGEQDPINSATNERAAYHEAGHAIAAIWHEIELDRVTIVPEGGALGYVEHRFSGLAGLEEDREKLEAQALIALAGPACEAHHFGKGRKVDWNAEDYRHDVVQASVLLQSLSAHEDEGAAYFDWIAERAVSLVAMPRFVEAADALAEALIERRELTGEQASELINATWKSMRSQLGLTI